MKEKEIRKAIKDLNNKDAEKRIKAIMTLGNSGEDGIKLGVVDHLIMALNDRDANARAWAAASLGKIGNSAKKSIEFLIQLLDDTDEHVIDEAVAAIRKIEPTFHGTNKEEILAEYKRRQEVKSEQEYWDIQARSMTMEQIYDRYYYFAEQAQKNLDENDYHEALMLLEKARFWAEKINYVDGLTWIQEKIKECDSALSSEKDHKALDGKYVNLIKKIAFKSELNFEDRVFLDVIREIAIEKIDQRVKIIKKFKQIYEQNYSPDTVAEFFSEHGFSLIKEWFNGIYSMDPSRINVEFHESLSTTEVRVDISYLFNTKELFLIEELAEKYGLDYQEGRFELYFIQAILNTLSEYFNDILNFDYQFNTLNISTERTLEGLLVKYQGNATFA
ncbi:MAG: HEAT repeat domain-containing protein [Candidatus Helarchaeales archaeon]